MVDHRNEKKKKKHNKIHRTVVGLETFDLHNIISVDPKLKRLRSFRHHKEVSDYSGENIYGTPVISPRVYSAVQNF